MGVALYVVLDNPEPGFDAFTNGKALARAAEALGELAQAHGLRSPYDLVSMSEAELEALIEDEVDIEEGPPSEQMWFTAEEGLTWVRALRPHVEAADDRLLHRDLVLEDLAELEAVLERAQGIGARWHLAIDF